MEAMFEEFLSARPVAVVGASADRSKYGNIVLRNLRGRGWEVYAVNPREHEIEGAPAYPNLAGCPTRPELAVIVTPPPVTLKVIEEAHRVGVRRVWLQPGAESAEAVDKARELGLQVVHDACIMVMAARKRADGESK